MWDEQDSRPRSGICLCPANRVLRVGDCVAFSPLVMALRATSVRDQVRISVPVCVRVYVCVCSGVVASWIYTCLQEVAMGVADCRSALCIYGLGETGVCGCGSLWLQVCVAESAHV